MGGCGLYSSSTFSSACVGPVYGGGRVVGVVSCSKGTRDAGFAP